MKLPVIICITILTSGLIFGAGQQSEGQAAGKATGEVAVPGELAIYASPTDFTNATGKTLPAYSESPKLAQLVADGKLPSVSDRLPTEPVVVDPKNEIGTYGGDYKTPGLSPVLGHDAMFGRLQNMLTLTPDRTTTIPNLARDWETSDDLTATTFTLREGLKWSDGSPVTTDDVMFWYEDYLINTEVTTRPGSAWRPGGKVVEITKLNDYQVRFQFGVPYPAVVNKFAFSPYTRCSCNVGLLPRHYLEQFHIKYNPKAKEQAKEAGYDSWAKWFLSYGVGGDEQGRQTMGVPEIRPWVLNKIDDYGNRYYDRNAYYWKVDTQGQQLPYLDRQIVINSGNMDTVNLKAIAGEFDVATFSLTLDNFPLYKENEQAGDYSMLLWTLPRNEMAYGFNLTYPDPELKKIFNDLRFRQAMSVAIDRNELNKVVALGRAVPRQATGPLPPEGFFTEDWMGEHFAEYDVTKANQLLDEMGLKWDSDRKWRLRPDGKTLEILIEYSTSEGSKETIHQMTAEYWGAVGVKILLKKIDGGLLREKREANQLPVYTFHFDNRGPYGMIWREAPHFKTGIAPPYRRWADSGGAEGMEPPEEIKKIFSLINDLMQAPLGSDPSIAIGKDLLSRHVKGLYRIGTLDYIPQPVMVKNGLMTNFTEVDVWAPEGLWHNNTIPEQWFWKE